MNRPAATIVAVATAVAMLVAVTAAAAAEDGAAGRHVVAPAAAPPGPEFQRHQTAHFDIYYDKHLPWVKQRAALLERAHDQFYTSLEAAGWTVEPLPRRLVCILFFEKEAFADYARRTDRLTQDWPSGYYSSRTNRIAFYNDMTAPALAQYGSHINRLQAQINNLHQRVSATPKQSRPAEHAALRRELKAKEKQVNKHRRKQQAAAERANASKTTHEAIHQIAFNCGLQKPGVVYPFWLSEGLATNFEALDPDKAFGPTTHNSGRARVLMEARDQGRLVPLAHFITLRQPPTPDRETVGDHYAQAWGLFHLLFRQDRAGLGDYIERRAAAGPGRTDDATLRRDFAETLGDPATVERSWQRFVSRLGTRERGAGSKGPSGERGR